MRTWIWLGAAAAWVSPAAAQVSYASSRYLYIEQLSDMAGSCWQPDTGFTAFTYEGCRIIALADESQRVSVIFVFGGMGKDAKGEEREKVEKTAGKIAELFDLPNKPKITMSEDTASAMLAYSMLFNQAKERNSGLINTSRLAALHYILSGCSGSLRGWHDSGISFWIVKNAMRFEVTLDMVHDPIEYAELRIASEHSAKFDRSSKNVLEIVTGTTYFNNEVRADLARELNAQRMVMADTSSDSYITWKAKVFRAGTEERIKEANKKGRTVRNYVFDELTFPNEEARLPQASLSSTRKVKRFDGTEGGARQRGTALGMTRDEWNAANAEREGKLQEKQEKKQAAAAPKAGTKKEPKPAAAGAGDHASQPLTPQEAMEAYIKRINDIAAK